MTTTPKPRPILLDPDGLKRLRASIAHWKRLASGKRRKGEDCFADHCALCKRWAASGCATSPEDACPVYQATGHTLCACTPYAAAARASYGPDGFDSSAFRAAAAAELAFLRDLLARAKEKP